MTPATARAAAAAVLALRELEALGGTAHLPEPAVLAARLQARTPDLHALTGVLLAYLGEDEGGRA